MMCFDLLFPSSIPPDRNEEGDDRDDSGALGSVGRGMMTIAEVSRRFPGFLAAFREYVDANERPEASLSDAELTELSTACLQSASSFLPIPELHVRPRSLHRCVASPSYYHHPRYDYVQVAEADELGQPTIKWFGQLHAIFKYNAVGYSRIENL